MFKVGMEAFTAEGPMLARYLISNGQKVFLDLKFHDIPNTVRGACRAAAAMGVTLLNVHAFGGRKMLRAAAEGAEEGAKGNHARPRVLAVTMLTSLADQDLEDLGIAGPPQGAALNDQSRTATPGAALADGADYLVIGRPITGAADPAAAARTILEEMEKSRGAA